MLSMKKLLTYLNSLDPSGQADFAEKCGTSVGYIRKAISTGQKFGEALCILFERESDGFVTCEELRPDLVEQWAYIRGTEKVSA